MIVREVSWHSSIKKNLNGKIDMAIDYKISLSPEEQRVLGVLMEKFKTTPEYYPMSVNAIMVGCNQKTSRSPVVSYTENDVMKALNTLKNLNNMVGSFSGTGIRTLKYKQFFNNAFNSNDAEYAVMCLLLLRGPQTVGELNTNSGRIYEFKSLEEVQKVLDNLSAREIPLVIQLERRPGQKEPRYIHNLGDVVYDKDVNVNNLSETNQNNSSGLIERIETLEQELKHLKEIVSKLEELL